MNTSYKFSLDKIKSTYQLRLQKKPNNKYIVLYKAIKECILKIDLPYNWLLPSTRVLSEELGVSRTTVNKSYELLQLEKLITSKIGSGFRISYNATNESSKLKTKSKAGTSHWYPEISEKGKAFRNNIALVNKDSNHLIAFRPGLPPLDAFPVNQWKKLLNTYWRHIKSSNLSYSSTTGLNELKKSIANYLHISRNIKCDHKQIVIVSGSLQSLYLIATTLIDKNDGIVIENPVFPNVHSVFKSTEGHLIPLNLDAEGIQINKLTDIRKSPKIVHVTPSNHYPLGVKMSLTRRQEILSWASKHRAVVIENDYENEIANQNFNMPTIFSLDSEDRTIYMGTFNRLLHPSIRLGYMIVPKYLISTVEALQEHSHKFVSPTIQVVMTQFIEKNYLYQHIKNSIAIANERYVLFCKEFNAISSHLKISVEDCSSFHVVAKLKNQSKPKLEAEILSKLQHKKITAHSLSKCYIGPDKLYGLIMGYSAVHSSKLKQTIKLMKGII